MIKNKTTMDYEILYKNALERAKKFIEENPLVQNLNTWIKETFPELKEESEDEKVRKALIEMVHDTTGDELWVDYNVHKEEALAWLEKQGESYTKRDVDNAWLEGMCDAKRELEKQSKQKSSWTKEDDVMLDTIEGWLDTLCEYLKDSRCEYIPNVKYCIDRLKALKQRIGG